MRQNTESRAPKESTDRSKSLVDSAIIDALSSGVKAASSLKEEVIDFTGCSEAQYFKRLAALRDDLKSVAFVHSGRERYYALFQNRDKLIPYLKKHGDVELYVVDNARYLLGYMMREMDYRRNPREVTAEVQIKSRMLNQAVDCLRESYTRLPKFPDYEEDGNESEYILALHRYLLDIMRFFDEA